MTGSSISPLCQFRKKSVKTFYNAFIQVLDKTDAIYFGTSQVTQKKNAYVRAFKMTLWVKIHHTEVPEF